MLKKEKTSFVPFFSLATAEAIVLLIQRSLSLTTTNTYHHHLETLSMAARALDPSELAHACSWEPVRVDVFF